MQRTSPTRFAVSVSTFLDRGVKGLGKAVMAASDLVSVSTFLDRGVKAPTKTMDTWSRILFQYPLFEGRTYFE